MVGKNLNTEGMGSLVVNINIKLLLIAVVRMYCSTPKMLKETEYIGFESSFLSLVAFRLGGGGGGRVPGPSGYDYCLMITVQVCPHIN